MTETTQNRNQALCRSASARFHSGYTHPAGCALGVALTLAANLSWAADGIGIGVELTYISDNNVSRGTGADALSDNILAVSANYTWRLPVAERTRLVVQPSLGAESYLDYEGLSNIFAGLSFQYQWRPGSGFQTPTLTALAKVVVEEYKSGLRDGVRYSYGVSTRSLLTDRIGLYGALTRDTRTANHSVFDTATTGVAVNLDYTVMRGSTVYLGLGYRQGDVVSSVRPVPPYYGGGVVVDDGFPGTGLEVIRVDGSAQLYTLGFNYMLSERHALDVSGRLIRASTDSGVDYDSRQLALSYLGRF
jgi:hypothetical protein